MDQLPTYANIIILIIFLWSIPWKIYAVWLAAKHNHKKWFVALLILNTLAILEIFYVFKVAKKSWADVRRDFNKAFASMK